MDCFSCASTCSDVSSDTGSVQSPFTPVQSSTSQLINSNTTFDNNNNNKKSIISTMTTISTTPSLNLDSSNHNNNNNNSLLSSAERDRKQREFIPDSKKDDKYWERRRKNNEAAKRSREKRRQNDILMECRINQLNVQNHKLRQDLLELKLRFGVPLDDEDRKFMDNLSSSSPNGGYNDQHNNNNNNTNNTDNTDNDNNSDGEMTKLSEIDCCMLSTTKSRNNSLSMDDSQNEVIVKRDRLTPLSSAIPTVTPTPTPTPTPLSLSSSAPSSTSMMTTLTPITTTTTTNLFIQPSTLPNILPSVIIPTPLSSSSLLPSVVQGNLNGNQLMGGAGGVGGINLTTTESTVASNIPSVHTIPNNFLFSQLNSLDSTDLLTLKRIFTSLGVGCLPSTTTSSPSSSSSPSVIVNQHSSSTPLIAAAAAAAAAVAAVASNGGVTLSPLSPGNSLSNSVMNTTPTVASFNSLTSLNTTAALLLRQAALIPPCTNPSSSLPSSHISTPLQQHHQTTMTTATTTINNNNNINNSITSSGSNSINSDGQYENNSNLINKLSISSPSPCCILPLDSRCPSVHSVKSDPSNNSNDYLESPLDLSLCYSMKTENNNSDLVLSDSTITSDPMIVDKRYQDRRRRNNEAVRRCRENKRARMSGSFSGSNNSGSGIVVGSRGFSGSSVSNSRTEVVAEKLQSENRCLRSELTGLSMEVKALRRLLSVDEELSQHQQQEQEEQGNTPEASNVNNNININDSSNNNNNNNIDTSTNHRNSSSSTTVVSNGVTPDFYSDTDDIQVTMMIPKKMRVKAIPHKLHQRFSLPSSPTPISTTNSIHHHQYQSYHHSNSNNMNDEDIDNYKIRVDESILNTEKNSNNTNHNNDNTHDGIHDKMVDEMTTPYTSYVDNINSINSNNDNDQLHCKIGKKEESIDYFKHVSSSSSSSSIASAASSSSSNSSDEQTNRIQQLSSSPSPLSMSDEYANKNNEDNSTEEKIHFSTSSTIAIDDNKEDTCTPTSDDYDNQSELTIDTTTTTVTNVDGIQSISMPSNEIHLSNNNNNMKEENEKLVVIHPRGGGGGRKRTLKSSIHTAKISRSDPTSTITTTIPSTDITTNSGNSNTIEEVDTSHPVPVHNIHPVSTSPLSSSPSGNTDDASYFIPSEKSVHFTVDSNSSNPCATAKPSTTATAVMTPMPTTRNSGKGDSILT
uniref:BZIP domain-containing protein n=1 Tax=Trichobilharzia regenti TaxID=157069 RepID=A0AA85IUH9_TRIRE|nr:unnamed protein product [Trichobilharzia regenti]